MTDINRYNQVQSVISSTQFPVWDSVNGVEGRASAQQVADFVNSLIGGASGVSTQYASPNATGFSVSVKNSFNNWLLLTPLAGYAAGTLVLPDSPVNLQQVTVSCTQSVTTLTVSGNGKTVNGAPTTLAANATFSLRYDGLNQSWYRI